MEDALPAFVLHSEAVNSAPMNGPPIIPGAETDEQLMQAYAQGRSAAFSALFARYRQPLFGFFRRRVPDPAHAEELAQETFLAVLRAASRYQPTALFRTWLYAIAFKILRAHRRKAAFRATFLGAPRELPEPAAPGSLDVEVMMRQAVARLDALDREVLLLREFEQLSYAEIASLLALPLNTVRSRLFRARLALHSLLAAPHVPAAPASKEAL
ncbi:MAG TPA: sigma-70 family RNA polymerase sigma factor [Terracidiphilus sp.]|nr:sigma-70 family RNA polymerase sigma factor [Terracidiphilus sp.]